MARFSPPRYISGDNTWGNRVANFENGRVATRYDKTVDSFLGFIQLASVKIWLKFVNWTKSRRRLFHGLAAPVLRERTA